VATSWNFPLQANAKNLKEGPWSGYTIAEANKIPVTPNPQEFSLLWQRGVRGDFQ